MCHVMEHRTVLIWRWKPGEECETDFNGLNTTTRSRGIFRQTSDSGILKRRRSYTITYWCSSRIPLDVVSKKKLCSARIRVYSGHTEEYRWLWIINKTEAFRNCLLTASIKTYVKISPEFRRTRPKLTSGRTARFMTTGSRWSLSIKKKTPRSKP